MATCELCGKTAPIVPALVEGVSLDICSACAKFGKILHRPKVEAILQKSPLYHKQKQDEPKFAVVENYADCIRKKREELGIKQIDLARMVAERESVIQKMENGELEPSLDLAKKLEKRLHIKLIEENKDDLKAPLHEKTEGFTLGHFIKSR